MNKIIHLTDDDIHLKNVGEFIYKCPVCEEVHIIKIFKYCPDCGVRIKFEDDE